MLRQRLMDCGVFAGCRLERTGNAIDALFVDALFLDKKLAGMDLRKCGEARLHWVLLEPSSIQLTQDCTKHIGTSRVPVDYAVLYFL